MNIDRYRYRVRVGGLGLTLNPISPFLQVLREDLEGVKYDPAARVGEREETSVPPLYVWKVRCTDRVKGALCA